jgi:glycosyltransferase involved in cell wall biosynthesis
MNINHLNYGIIHSLIGKNDGVSIVIDQTVNAMVKDLDINLGNIFFLAAHSSPRFNAETHEIFWHKSEENKTIIRLFSEEAQGDLDHLIHENALVAKDIIADFVQRNSIDMLIAHNTSHPYNFITAVGLGYYLEELRRENLIWPKVLVWWHDSYFERAAFAHPGPVIRKYLRYLPGTLIDGIVFINSTQPDLARKMYAGYGLNRLDTFFTDRTAIIPNTHDIEWDWEGCDWTADRLYFPKQDPYNQSFLQDTELQKIIAAAGYSLAETFVLLQHTRIVPRKKIEVAIDLAFELEERFVKEGRRKCVVLLITGHSGDEQMKYKDFLSAYYHMKIEASPQAAVFLIYGEHFILSHRDIIVDKKYYNFFEIPGVVASLGGIGTYFSETEGFGNNLLEMIAAGLPVLINKYAVYESDVEPLGFDLPFIEDTLLTPEMVDIAYRLATDLRFRNQIVSHNLKVLSDKLGHAIIAKSLIPLISNIFTRGLC